MKAAFLALFAVAMTTSSSLVAAPNELQPRSVLIMDLDATGVDASTVETLEGIIAAELSKERRLKVIAGNDIRRLLDLEAEKQAMGCESDASCLAEIAGALGAELVVIGQLGRLGPAYSLTLTVVDTSTAEPLNRKRWQVDDVGVLPSVLETDLPTLVEPAVRDVEEPIAVVWPVVTTAVTGTALFLGATGMAVGLFSTYVNANARTSLDKAATRATGGPAAATNLAGARAEYVGAQFLYNVVGVPSLWIGGALLVTSAASAGATAYMIARDIE